MRHAIALVGLAGAIGMSSFFNLGKVDNAAAQGATSAAQTFQYTGIDTAVPPAPALAAIDVKPQAVIRAGTQRDLALTVLNGIDPNGTLQTGLAFDFVPYFALRGDQTTLGQYASWSSLGRAVRTSSISIATTKASTNDDDAVRLGVGYSVTLLDRGDPRLDRALIQCIQDELTAALPTTVAAEPADAGTTPPVLRPPGPTQAEVAQKIRSQCRDNPAYKSNLWNRSAINLGVAPTFITDSGELGDLENNGVSAWATVAYGFDRFKRPAYETIIDANENERVVLTEDPEPTGFFDYLERHAQLILHARYRGNEKAQVDGRLNRQDLTTVASQFRLIYDRFNINAEGALLHAERKRGLDNDTYYRLSLGTDVRIPGVSNTYLSLTIGGELGRDDEDSTFVASALKWRFGTEPTIRAGTRPSRL
jgi:hypothetical protein